MTEPVLSVLMTVYQGARYLPATLESILTQTFMDFELIAVDDGSSDGTGALLDAAAARDERLIVLHNPLNLGITRSMNRLFPLARGRFVTRHDGDDVSAPERFARQVAFLEAHPAVGMVSAHIDVIGPDDTLQPIEKFISGDDNASIQQTLYDYNCLCQGSVMFRRECRAAVGLYDEALELSEDYDFWLRMAEITQVTKLPEALYLYRLHPGSVTRLHYGQQLLRKALGLEKALARRFGAQPPQPLTGFAARDYLEAAVHLDAAGDSGNLRLSLAGVLRHRPEWFETEKMSIPIPATPAGEEFARSVFAEIAAPAERQRRLARYLARLHMRAVFNGAARKDWAQVNAHLLPAVRHDPAWLLNRGVCVIAARGLAWRLRHGRWTGQAV
jgi:hypothetical protein